MSIVYAEPPAVEIIRHNAEVLSHCVGKIAWASGFTLTLFQLGSAIFFIAAIAFIMKAAVVDAHQKRFYWPVTFACFVAGCAYFAMSQDEGWLISHNCKQMFFSRYVDMLFGLPMIVLALGLVCYGNFVDIAASMGFVALMCVSLFLGSVSYFAPSRWAWFLISLFWLGLSSRLILGEFASSLDPSSPVNKLGVVVVTCLCLYPFLWVFCEGFHIFSMPLEVFCFGAVDVTVKVIFGVLLMLTSSAYHNIPPLSYSHGA